MKEQLKYRDLLYPGMWYPGLLPVSSTMYNTIIIITNYKENNIKGILYSLLTTRTILPADQNYNNSDWISLFLW